MSMFKQISAAQHKAIFTIANSGQPDFEKSVSIIQLLTGKSRESIEAMSGDNFFKLLEETKNSFGLHRKQNFNMVKKPLKRKFNSDPNLKEMSLKDGRMIVLPEGMGPGLPVFTLEDSAPLAPGNYELSYGKTFTVTKPGVIATLTDDIKAGKMSYLTELRLKKQNAQVSLAKHFATLKK